MGVPFNTAFQHCSYTKAVVDAEAQVDTRTGKPTKVSSDAANPLIDTSEAGKVGVGPTDIDFETVGSNGSLVGDFTTVVVTAAETKTDGLAIVLSIGCEGQTHDSN